MVRRRIGEAIAIGEDIEVEIIEISRTRVKLGIRAPREVRVNRLEAAAAAAENRRASVLVSEQSVIKGVTQIVALLRNVSGPLS